MKSEITLEVDGDALKDLVVSGLKLEEGLSRPYRAEISAFTATPRSPAKLRDDTLGRRVTVKITEAVEDAGKVTRYLNGVITSAAHLGSRVQNEEIASFCGTDKRRLTSVRLIVEPQLKSLAFSRRTMDYPDTTPLGVVKTVLSRSRIDFNADNSFLASEEYSGKVRFVQRDETDLAFIHRVMARYGLSYTFTHSSKGTERMVISDGGDYPPLSPLEFEGLSGYSDGQEIAFSTEKTGSGVFHLLGFSAESRMGYTGVKDGFLRPAQTKPLEKEAGDASSDRVWLRNEAPAGYGEDVDDTTLDKDFERFTKASETAMHLAENVWSGETSHVAAMPGRILKITGFVDGTDEDDEPVKARVTGATLAANLLAKDEEVFHIRFDAMDFADDLKDKRWVPTQTNASANDKREVMCEKSGGVSLLEAVVCDRSGKFDDSQTLNTIVTSSHATPEMPWVFLVRNPNPGANDDDNKLIDVVMTQPLGGKRSGLYRFPRVGERVFVMLTGDRAVLMGYVPDRTGSFSDFPENGDKWARQSTSLRYSPPTEEQKTNGDYSEIGFSYSESEIEAIVQRIIDGTCADYLLALSERANDVEKYNSVQKVIAPALDQLRADYYDGKDGAVDAVIDYATKLSSTFGASADPSNSGVRLRLMSRGAIVGYGRSGIDLSTDGVLNIRAKDVVINGRRAMFLSSEGSVTTSVGATSQTINGCGALIRARRLLGARGNYDSEVCVNAADGVSVTGANVRMSGLFSTAMSDAMGGNVAVSNGELRGSGAVVDFATATRSVVTEAFQNLPENSGLNAINDVLSAWQGGTTPDGSARPLRDGGTGAFVLASSGSKAGEMPIGNFRGTESALTLAAEDLTGRDGWSAEDASADPSGFDVIGGANEHLTISQRELIRAKAFADQMDTHRTTLETVVNGVVEGKSSSVTIHGHSLDLNVDTLNSVANNNTSDGVPEGGAA